jgi:type IV pilus assembly protein PilF
MTTKVNQAIQRAGGRARQPAHGAPAAWASILGLLLALLLGSALLTACATKPDGSSANSTADLVTASDEPENRKRARLRLELAVGYFEQGQTTVALDELKQALATDPTLPDAYNLRGLVYMRLNEIPLAEESFKRALALSPRDANVMHNYGWMLCQQERYSQSQAVFAQAIATPLYAGRAKSLMAQGLCQVRAGLLPEGELSLQRAYELEPGNPITGYNLANLLFKRGEFSRSQFYIRRINNSELANAESLWLGIKIERSLDNRDAMQQLGAQLKKRFAQARETLSYERSAFDE